MNEPGFVSTPGPGNSEEFRSSAISDRLAGASAYSGFELVLDKIGLGFGFYSSVDGSGGVFDGHRCNVCIELSDSFYNLCDCTNIETISTNIKLI